MKDIYISGFADEISSSFDEQLKTVRELGMQYISLRSADKKGIADFTVEEVKTDLLPRLQVILRRLLCVSLYPKNKRNTRTTSTLIRHRQKLKLYIRE